MRPDPALADRIDIVDRGAKPDRLHDRRRASLKPVWRLAISDVIPLHLANHFAAAVEWRHGREVFALAVQRANAGRSVQLVTGDDKKVAIDVADVDIHMNGRLRAVDEHRNSP